MDKFKAKENPMNPETPVINIFYFIYPINLNNIILLLL